MKLPRDYTSKNGGHVLDIDYANIDFNHASVAIGHGGWYLFGDEKEPSGILETGEVTVEFGYGFATKEAAEAEMLYLREFGETGHFSDCRCEVCGDSKRQIETKDGRILTVKQWRAFVAEIEKTLAELETMSSYKGDGSDRLALDIPDDGERHLPRCQARGCGNLAEGKIRLDSGRIADICQSCLTETIGTDESAAQPKTTKKISKIGHRFKSVECEAVGGGIGYAQLPICGARWTDDDRSPRKVNGIQPEPNCPECIKIWDDEQSVLKEEFARGEGPFARNEGNKESVDKVTLVVTENCPAEEAV